MGADVLDTLIHTVKPEIVINTENRNRFANRFYSWKQIDYSLERALILKPTLGFKKLFYITE